MLNTESYREVQGSDQELQKSRSGAKLHGDWNYEIQQRISLYDQVIYRQS